MEKKILQIKDLYPHVEIECWGFNEKILKSIKKYGLLHPVVVVPVTLEGWGKLRTWNPDILPPPSHLLVDKDWCYQIRCGHNRVSAATQLGWKEIPCVIFKRMSVASGECGIQRELQRVWSLEQRYGTWS